MKKSENINLDVRVTDLAEGYWQGTFTKLPANKVFILKIDYPLSTCATFKLKTGKQGMGLIRLLNEIGKAYTKVYVQDEHYGIWGHDIGDLVIEGININYKNKTISLSVGS